MTIWHRTLRQRVEIRLTGGGALAGEVHLQPLAELHGGPEFIVDLLNRAEPFFAVTLEGERPVLVSKQQVILLTVAPAAGSADPDRASAASRLELELEMADGTRAEGAVVLELPPERQRLLDFLNYAPRFFEVSAPDRLRILNRDFVRVVSPLAQVRDGPA